MLNSLFFLPRGYTLSLLARFKLADFFFFEVSGWPLRGARGKIPTLLRKTKQKLPPEPLSSCTLHISHRVTALRKNKRHRVLKRSARYTNTWSTFTPHQLWCDTLPPSAPLLRPCYYLNHRPPPTSHYYMCHSLQMRRHRWWCRYLMVGAAFGQVMRSGHVPLSSIAGISIWGACACVKTEFWKERICRVKLKFFLMLQTEKIFFWKISGTFV